MARRILLANPFGIGDVLFTTPVIRSLRETFPDGKIGYVCNRRVAPLLEANPRLDSVFIFEKDEYRTLWRTSKRRWFGRFWKFLREIRKHRFETFIDFSLNWHYSFLAMLLGIPTRIGFDYRHRGRFLTQPAPLLGFEERHVTEYYLDLLRLMGIPAPSSRELELTVPEADRSWARDFLQSHTIPEETLLIGISPGGGASWGKEASYKHWPRNHFIWLANRLLKDNGGRPASVILFGTEKEAPICEAIAEGVSGKAVVTAGQTHLGQLSALVERCHLFIGNDAGALHMAVALGIPTLSFFGPVDPVVYGPFPPERHHRTLTTPLCCRPCYRRFKYPLCERQVCLEWVTPEKAFEEAKDLLKTSPLMA